MNKDGVESFSNEITWNTGGWAQELIMRGCDQLYDKFELFEAYDVPYKENGVGFYLRFQGMNEDPGQFSIVNSDLTPLTGENIVFEQETIVPYGTNLFYEPIPFEFLKTYETKPQIIVSVDNLPAVCHNLTCDFTYIEPVGEVSSFTFTEATKKVVLTGLSIPINAVDIKSVTFAKANCIVDSATLTATNLECILDKEPTCGTWVPKLVSNMGHILNAAAIVPVTVACTVTSATPISDLNLLGGDNITISGTNFPHDLTSTIVLKFSDTQQSVCVPQVSSSTELVCLTSAFDVTLSAGASLTMTVSINS